MGSLKRYPIPWNQILRLAPFVRHGRAAPVGQICEAIALRMRPQPEVRGLGRLPDDPRFVLIANHHQRPGLWIAHPASYLTMLIQRWYNLPEPPVRWIVTANWPAWRVGTMKIPSPGDWLLPRVATALSCYPVPVCRANPAGAAGTLRRLLKQAARMHSPIGMFPEGVYGVAGRVADPLPGVSRLLSLLARTGLPAVPVSITEEESLRFEFCDPVAAVEILAASDPAQMLMERIRRMQAGESQVQSACTGPQTSSLDSCTHSKPRLKGSSYSGSSS